MTSIGIVLVMVHLGLPPGDAALGPRPTAAITFAAYSIELRYLVTDHQIREQLSTA